MIDTLKKFDKPWEGRIEPFEICPNVYFVGTYQASSHLIDTKDGCILIDTGYSNTLYLVIDSVYKFGYKPTDIKYIINTHWHGDHTEATAALAELSGAKTIIDRFDKEKAARFFDADIVVKDGDELSLGDTTIQFMETPGHTKGTLSLFFNVKENGNCYRVGTFGGAGANTLVKEKYDFDGCREAYFSSLERLKKEKVDIFIGNHVWNNDTYTNSEILRKTGENKFYDKDAWFNFLVFCEERLKKIIQEETC